jgi:predicted enzyme related to lactoylglutathione lyase
MPNPVVHFEIMSADNETLEKFYAELFGWHVQSMPEMSYGLVDTHAGTGINGGIGSEPSGASRVTFYVAVADLQKTLDTAEKLGGKTAMPVTELPMVTLAQFIDPQGNLIGLIHDDPSQEAPGVSAGSNPPVFWFEVLGSDAKKLADFYTKLFGWDVEFAPDSPGDYGHIGPQDGKGIGGGIGSSPNVGNQTTVYVLVDDLQKYLDRAESLGGKTLMPPESMGTVSIAVFADPAGNVFGLYKDN